MTAISTTPADPDANSLRVAQIYLLETKRLFRITRLNSANSVRCRTLDILSRCISRMLVALARLSGEGE